VGKDKKKGERTIKNWIDKSMYDRSCVIVLIGEQTSERKWVQYEIEKAWNNRKGIAGIYIHNIKCPQAGFCRKGKNPFDSFILSKAAGEDWNPFDKLKLSYIIKCYDPALMMPIMTLKKTYRE
jgi:hypothetical protein